MYMYSIVDFSWKVSKSRLDSLQLRNLQMYESMKVSGTFLCRFFKKHMCYNEYDYEPIYISHVY